MSFPTIVSTSEYRGKSNTLFIKGLFFETADHRYKQGIKYTLKNWDHTYDGHTYPSLYLRYMSANDPTEWFFVKDNLDGWEHWERICATAFFKPYVAQWRKELMLSIQATSLARVIREAKSTSKEAFMANKFLLQKEWIEKPQKGAPKKEDIQKAATDIALHERQINNDYDRVLERIN